MGNLKKSFLLFGFMFSCATQAQTQIEKKKESFLSLLNAMNKGSEQRIITGEFCSWGKFSDYKEIETIHQKSGQWLGVLGIDYHSLDMTTKNPPMLGKNYQNPNKIVLQYGSPVCNMSMHLNNPFCDSSAWSRHGDLKQLFIENSKPRKNIEAQWDSICQGIKQLQDSGIIVMLRPYHEMNGNWFWWGQMNNANTDDFKQLWRLTYNYFTLKKGLKNIVWCYSPFSWPHQYLNEYPGGDVVDVVCVDYYDSSMKEWLRLPYNALLTLNKPLGIGEYGCMSSSDWFWESKYIHDYANFITEIKQYPKICFFLAWNLHWGLSYHKNLEILNDPVFINKEELGDLLNNGK